MTRRWLAVGVIAALTLWSVSSAHAQGNPAKCTASIVSPEERIAGCTAMIETGARKPVVTWAYAARARAYQEIRDFDHAIADYT